MGHRDFKDRMYAQFARVGAAMASEKRLELIDLLAQAPRHVEALADETGMSVANTSQHLQALKAAHLVDSARDGTRIVYRLGGEEVLALWLALRAAAEAGLAEVGQIVRNYANDGVPGEQVSRKDLRSLVGSESVVLIDVRPRLEYEYRHIPSAIAMPLEELGDRLVELPRDKQVIVYCRGSYCQFADDAVVLLRQHGFDALRLEGGWPEWLMEDRSTVS
jgi:rhodanese-related sulfurtransferase/DNA-binding MarR family transcriptional regulator